MANFKDTLILVVVKLLKLKKLHLDDFNLLTLTARDPWIQQKLMKKRVGAHDLWAVPIFLYAIFYFFQAVFI